MLAIDPDNDDDYIIYTLDKSLDVKKREIYAKINSNKGA